MSHSATRVHERPCAYVPNMGQKTFPDRTWVHRRCYDELAGTITQILSRNFVNFKCCQRPLIYLELLIFRPMSVGTIHRTKSSMGGSSNGGRGGNYSVAETRSSPPLDGGTIYQEPVKNISANSFMRRSGMRSCILLYIIFSDTPTWSPIGRARLYRGLVKGKSLFFLWRERKNRK